MTQWKLMALPACLEKSPRIKKIPRKEFKNSGTYPIVSQEKGLVNGYWDDESDVVRIERPLIVFGDHTQIVKLIDFDFVVGADGVKLLKPKSFLDCRFLYYFLLANPFKTLGYARHSRLLNELSINVPPLPEQKRIVAILDEAFAGIDTAVANTEKNLANARELFESYLNSVFNQRASDWAERKLGDASLLEIIDGDRGGKYPKKSDFKSQGYCLFLNTKNVRLDGFKFETLMFITKDKDNALGKGKLKRRDVVLTTRGTIGNLGLYDDGVKFDHLRINSGMLILRPNEQQIVSEYLFEIMRSSIVRNQINRVVSGAAQPQLPIKTLVNISLPVPINLQDQKMLVFKLREIEAEIMHLESVYQQKLAALAELKQSLLQKAFSGELTASKEAPDTILKAAEVA